jgi:hypothetical protein
MLSLAWVEHELELAINGPNTPQNARDCALLFILRDHLREVYEPPEPERKEEPPQKENDSKRQAVLLTAHSARLDTVPTLTQIEDAIGAVSVNTREEKRRMQDAKTWASIIREKA